MCLILAPTAPAQDKPAAVTPAGGAYAAKVLAAKKELDDGHAAAAAGLADEAVRMDPDRFEAYAVSGAALSAQSKFREAAAALRLAVDRAPAAKRASLDTLLQEAKSSADAEAAESFATARKKA